MNGIANEPGGRLVHADDLAASAARPRALDEIYADELDVLRVQRAMDPAAIGAITSRLDALAPAAQWARPNRTMPIQDVQLLGADAPATPTYSAPRGVTLEAYLDSAQRHEGDLQRLFGPGFDLVGRIERTLALFAGGRPVRLARSADGRAYAPCTLRRMAPGTAIAIHHDYHYDLALYQELGPTLDRRTLVSYVFTLQRPESGGELDVYGVTPTTPDAPKLPNGFQWDAAAIEARYDRQRIDCDVGDLFLLAAGRCLHSVAKVEGSRPRITLGGFLAFDKAGDEVVYWS
ncbi:MAG: 2OG-Fe(II) oxygenase [Burkholderiales bacterium]|nr:2OG-Fe(II) oxygenase [Burkholderiales bacterium]